MGGDEQVGTLGQAVCTLLVSEHDSNDVMAAELLELLGDNAFEAVGELMDKRCEGSFQGVIVCFGGGWGWGGRMCAIKLALLLYGRLDTCAG